MKAKFLALSALVLGMVSCQNDFEGTKIGGDEVAVTLNVAVPDDATRAAGNDSAASGLQNIDLQNDYDIRYILEVYDERGTLAKDRIINREDVDPSTSFDLRLVPGRHYSFVVWADFIPQAQLDEADYHYNTTNIQAISLQGEQKANDESRDAYTGVFNTKEEGDGEVFSSATSVNITLTRPFAKLRVVTTDMNHLYSDLTSVTVAYTTPLYTTFNALTGDKGGLQNVASTTKVVYLTDDFKYTNESDYKKNGKMTLFADYFFGAEDDAIHFTLDATDATGMDIPPVQFNTNIPVQRNYLTTVMGPVLTDAANVKVEIKDAFENKDNPNDPPYYQVAVTNGVELVKALYEGREIIVLNDITVTAADVEAYLATTRAGEAINPVLNLNGFTITIENNGTDALVNLNGGTLTVEGDGAIESTATAGAGAGALVEGTTVVTGEATVAPEVAVDAEGNSAVKTGVEALAYVLANGGEFNFTEDLTAEDVLAVETANPVVINGAGFNLKTPANRAIRVAKANANVTINNLKVVSSAVMVYPSDVRGISIDPSISNVELTLNNCSIDFTDKTTNDWTYAVNVSGSGTGHKVTINGGTYEGANVINAHGAKNTIVVKNATLTSLYPDTANYISSGYYGACIWVLQNQGSSVYAEGNTFNGNNAMAFNLGTGTTLEEKDNIDNTMYYKNGTCYVGSSEKFQKAIAEGANNIVLGKGTFDLPSSLTQKEGTLTIKGRGNDVTVLNGAMNTNGNHPGNYANGVALEFEGLTFKTANNGYNGGFGHAVSVTFRESKIVGQFYAHSNAPHYFYNCTIDPLTGYLYTYGSDCVFEGCTFAASEGKALQIYEDGASGENTVTITNCAFVAAKQATTWDGKPVTGIDINSNGAKFEVYINNCTTTGFPTGLNSNSNLWNVKDGGKAHVNVYVDGAQVWFAGGIAPGVMLNEAGEYLIMNATGMFWFANEVNVNKNTFSGKVVKLAENINLNNVAWTPVGQTGATQFKGTFDGNNKTISNLKIDTTAENGEYYSTGIFGWLLAAKVKNVTVDGASIKGNHNVAAIAGYLEWDGCTVENCHVKNATIIGNYKNDNLDGDKCGAIVAYAGNANTYVKDCTATDCTVTASRDAGQIVGAGKEVNVTNCVATNVTVAHNGQGTGKNIRNEVIGRLL